MRDLFNLEWNDPDAERVAKMVKRIRGEWLNFVRYKKVETTKNLAERVLRPEVVFRKIIGGYH